MGRRGPLAGSEKRGAPTGIRFDPALKARIAEAAAKGQRSFSEEVALRLETSFGDHDVEQDFGDQDTYALCRLIASAFSEIKMNLGKAWFEHRLSFQKAAMAANEIMSYFEPTGTPLEYPDDAPLVEAMRAHSDPETFEKWRLAAADDPTLGKRSAQLAVWALERSLEGASGPHFDQLKPIARVLKSRLIAAEMAGAAGLDLRRSIGAVIALDKEDENP